MKRILLTLTMITSLLLPSLALSEEKKEFGKEFYQMTAVLFLADGQTKELRKVMDTPEQCASQAYKLMNIDPEPLGAIAIGAICTKVKVPSY